MNLNSAWNDQIFHTIFRRCNERIFPRSKKCKCRSNKQWCLRACAQPYLQSISSCHSISFVSIALRNSRLFLIDSENYGEHGGKQVRGRNKNAVKKDTSTQILMAVWVFFFLAENSVLFIETMPLLFVINSFTVIDAYMREQKSYHFLFMTRIGACGNIYTRTI